MAPNAKPTTLAALQKTKRLVATGPSGHSYRIQPMNMERYALAGGMPSQLRHIAMQGAKGIDAILDADDETLATQGAIVRDYMDSLVCQLVVEPKLTADDMEDLPPVDYRWLVQIALGEEDCDGEGRRLWGRVPLSLWGTFRDVHGCPSDCESCLRLQLSVADLQPR